MQSVPCLPKRDLPCWPKASEAGVQTEPGIFQPMKDSGRKTGSDLLFLLEAAWASPLRVGCQAVGHIGRGAGYPLWACGTWTLTQNRVLRGSSTSGSSRGPRAGLLVERAEAQWSTLAPMQEAYAITWGM